MTGLQALDSILSQVRPNAEVATTDPLDRGNRKRTRIVRFTDADPVVVQQSPDADAIRIEARLLELIDERTSIPVARPLASGANGFGWLVTPFVSGDDLHEQFTTFGTDTQRTLVETFGQYLAELHETFQFDRHGPLSVDNGQLTAPNGSDPRTTYVGGGIELNGTPSSVKKSTPQGEEWLARFGEASITRLPAEFDPLKPALRDRLQETNGKWGTAALFPWDFRPGNTLVNDGTITAVLDWEGPLAASPALSYAKAEYLVADWYVSRGEANLLRDAFRRGYESVRPAPGIEPVHRVAAIASTAVDSRGGVTNPRFPPVDRTAAIEFHCQSLERML